MRLMARILGVLFVGSLLVSPAPALAQTCGDGIIDPGETCDPPDPTIGTANQVKCRPDCTSCGDGVTQSDHSETCDPPDLSIDPANGQVRCRLDCTACGDGVVQNADVETCDIGRDAICSWCNSNCNDRIFPGDGYGGCTCGDDSPAMVALRAEIAADCQCGTTSSRSAFRRCVREKIAAIPDDLILPPCRHTTLKCLTSSVCGKPGAVTCCRTSGNGKERCVVKPDAAHCTAPKGGAASLGVSETCCDACP